jgi:hypothetical protein
MNDMKTGMRMWMVALIALLALAAPMISAQELQRNDSDDYGQNRDYDRNDRVRIDRYLDAELWTNHSDNEFYIGDNIVLNYRVNDDAFVAIYSIDTRGRVRLLFPGNPNEDNYMRGGVTYKLPDGRDDYDLSVTGPEGTETIQIVASREKFPIPDWYNNGLVADASDMDDYMDYLNSEYFVRYGGQRFAYDRTRIYVNEWEPDYFRPIYHPVYPHWSVCGNVYFDYPWGSSIYIDGIYWGCTPLFVPTILVGWHTVTVYDPWGYCWENDVQILRRHTVVLDRTVIATRPTVVSKYKEVRTVGYRDPVTNGYPKFKEVVSKKAVLQSGGKFSPDGALTKERLAEIDKGFTAPTKKYAKSVVPVTRTDRGFEAKGVVDDPGSQTLNRRTYGDGQPEHKAYEPGSYTKTRSGVSGSTDRSTYGSEGRRTTGKTESSGATRQTEPKTYEKPHDSQEKHEAPAVGHRSEPAPKSQPKVEKPSSGSSSSGKTESKKTEAAGKSSGSSQPQPAPPTKSRTDGGQRDRGRR